MRVVTSQQPDVLVALMPNREDLRIASEEGWYRIRSPELVERLRGWPASYRHVAFYQPATFEREKQCIRWYADIRGVSKVRRLDLFPNQPNHLRAQETYARLDLGPIQLLPRPVVSARPRRVLFVPTTWAKLALADELNDLFVGSPLEELMYRKLRELLILPEREYYVTCADPTKRDRPQRSFFLDFALFCRDRNLDIETDGDQYHTGSAAAAADNERGNLLEANKWHVMRFNTPGLTDKMQDTLSIIRDAVNKYGGIKEPSGVIRRFRNGILAPGQGVLELD
jgi:hypothetical protein